MLVLVRPAHLASKVCGGFKGLRPFRRPFRQGWYDVIISVGGACAWWCLWLDGLFSVCFLQRPLRRRLMHFRVWVKWSCRVVKNFLVSWYGTNISPWRSICCTNIVAMCVLFLGPWIFLPGWEWESLLPKSKTGVCTYVSMCMCHVIYHNRRQRESRS